MHMGWIGLAEGDVDAVAVAVTEGDISDTPDGVRVHVEDGVREGVRDADTVAGTLALGVPLGVRLPLRVGEALGLRVGLVLRLGVALALRLMDGAPAGAVQPSGSGVKAGVVSVMTAEAGAAANTAAEAVVTL